MIAFIIDNLGLVGDLWAVFGLTSAAMLVFGLLAGPARDLSWSNMGAAFLIIGLLSLVTKVKFDDWIPSLILAIFGIASFIFGVLLSPVPEDSERSRIGWVKDLTH